MSRQEPKKDIFGRYYKAKFPHYASSVIIPSTSKRRRRTPPVATRPKVTDAQQDSKSKSSRTEDSDTSIQSSCVYDRTQCSTTSEASKHVAQLIQEELPGCIFDPALLEEIQLKCEIYLRTLKQNKIQLNEEVVMNELRLKLRNWAGLMHQVDLDDEEDVEDDTTTIKQITGTVRSVRSSISEVDPQSIFFQSTRTEPRY